MRAPFPRVILSAALQARSRRISPLSRIAPLPSSGRTWRPLASGYVGVGGGFIMVPLMLSLIHIPMKLASGTSLIAVMILAVPGTITQAVLGNINWVAGIAVACGSIPGAALVAKLIPKVPERQLRFLFAGFLVVAAVLLVVNQLGVWG